jgi:hypothetical protein
MPANKYTRELYKVGTVKAEKAAMANSDPARKMAAMKAVAREGTTSAAGGRPAKPVQVIRTTVAMKPTPAPKKK